MRYFDGMRIYRSTLAELEKEKAVVESKMEKLRRKYNSRFWIMIRKIKERLKRKH